MFFIHWGKRGGAVELGSIGFRHCPRCDHDADFSAHETYVVRNVYWIFRWVTGRKTLTACGNCGAAFAADPSEIDRKAATRAIPLMDRLGWTIAVGLFGSLAVAGAIASAQESRSTSDALLAPRVGDLYEVNFAGLEKTPQAETMWTAMRVVNVTGNIVTARPAKVFFDTQSGLERDVNAGKVNQDSYYADDQLRIEVSGLQKMRDKGILAKAIRN